MESNQLSFDFIKQLKKQILASRYVVAKIANAEMLRLYFSVGKMMENEFKKNNWGAKVNDEIAAGLQQELPGLRGFSASNIRKMRLFYKGWSKAETICPTLSDKLKNKDNSILPTLSDKMENKNILATAKQDETEVSSFFSVSFSHHYEILLQIKNEADLTKQNICKLRHTSRYISLQMSCFFALALEKNRHYDIDWLTQMLLLKKIGKPKTKE